MHGTASTSGDRLGLAAAVSTGIVLPALGASLDARRPRCCAGRAALATFAARHRAVVAASPAIGYRHSSAPRPIPRPTRLLAAPQHAGRLQPRVHRRQGAQVEDVLKRFPGDRARDDDRRAPTTAATTRAINLQARPTARSAAHRRRSSRARSASAQADPRHRARGRLRPARSGCNLLGPDPDDADPADQRVRREGREDPGIADIGDVGEGADPALSIRAQQRRGARSRHHACSRSARRCARCSPATRSATGSAPDGQNYEVNVQLPKDRRQLASDLGNLYLTTNKRGPDGELRMVPLRQVAEIVESTSPQIIKRQDLQRRVALYANVEGRPSGDVSADVDKIIKADRCCRRAIASTSAGRRRTWRRSFRRRSAALGLAMIFIYLMLASQFASFTQPVAIMASLPFSLIGVLLALLLTGTTLNIFSIIGFIMLMGLVTKNAILLVDFANHARGRGATAGRRAARRGPGAAAADPDDDRGDDLRHAAAGAGARRRRRDAGADGPRDHRRRHHLDAADAGRRAGDLHLHRAVGRLLQDAAGQRLARRHHRRGAVRPGGHRAADQRRAAARRRRRDGGGDRAQRRGLLVVHPGQRLPPRVGCPWACWACWAS